MAVKNIFFISITVSLLASAVLAQNYSPPTLAFPMNVNNVKHRPRIVGGQEVASHSYPFMVAIIIYIDDISYFCGGTLIHPQWVLTAGHCLQDASHVEMIFGCHNFNQGHMVVSSHLFVHQNFSAENFYNDIGLIKLNEKIDLNDKIKIITINTDDDSFNREIGTTLGWGATLFNSISSKLRKVNVMIISNKECDSVIPFKSIITKSHICTSGRGFVGSCNGDSGGPLIHNGVQIGIVSFGVSNCAAGKPTGYTRLSEYSDWISNTMVSNSVYKQIASYCITFCTLCFVFLTTHVE